MAFFPKIEEYTALYEEELQNSAYQKVISQQEQWELAKVIGVSEPAWENVQNQYDSYLATGQKMPQIGEENLTTLIDFYRKGVAVFPPNADLFYLLANAYFVKWRQNFKGYEHILMARHFAFLALQIDKNHAQTKRLLPHLEEKNIQSKVRFDKIIKWILAILFVIGGSLVIYFLVQPLFQPSEESIFEAYSTVIREEGFVEFVPQTHAPDFEFEVYSSKINRSESAFWFTYELLGYLTNHGKPYVSIEGILEFEDENGQIVFTKKVNLWSMLEPDHNTGDILPVNCFVQLPVDLVKNNVQFQKIHLKIGALTPPFSSYTCSKGDSIPIIFENNAPNDNFYAESRFLHFEHHEDSLFVLEYLGKKPIKKLTYQIEWNLKNGNIQRSDEVSLVDDYLHKTPILSSQKRLGRLKPFSHEIAEEEEITATKIVLLNVEYQ